MKINDKFNNLVNWFGDKNKVLIALSGGVDSALVACAAFKKLGDSAIAVTADYKTLSKDELDTAKRVCQEIGIKQIILNYDELQNDNFVRNDSKRCFHCRIELGNHLLALAQEIDVKVIVDGTNLDDLKEYRPGIQALKSNGIRSPLVETSFTKDEIRKTARFTGLSIHDRPSNSCLASRIPWGQRVTAEKLTRIELGEIFIKQITNLTQVRVRDINGTAQIEVESKKIQIIDDKILNEIVNRFKMIGFVSVKIDQQGYRPGKINVITD